MNNGSGDRLTVSLRGGGRLKARQIRLTGLWLRPHGRALARGLPCVAARGAVAKVNVTTRATAASVTVRGAPGRGSSSNPSSRRVTKRRRHFPTVGWVTRSSRATAVWVFPAAHPRITRARKAVACAVFGRRAQFSSAPRSSALTSNVGIGRPSRRIRVLLSPRRTHSAATPFHELRTQDTRWHLDYRRRDLRITKI